MQVEAVKNIWDKPDKIKKNNSLGHGYPPSSTKLVPQSVAVTGEICVSQPSPTASWCRVL